jgi:hypothetical protein
MAQHLQVALLGLGAVDGPPQEAVEILMEARRDELAQRQPLRIGARNAKQVRAHHVHLQDGGVERQHEIADRRQQIDIVEIGLLGIWPHGRMRRRAPCRPRRRRPSFPAAQRA